jgi:hypothetical protein
MTKFTSNEYQPGKTVHDILVDDVVVATNIDKDDLHKELMKASELHDTMHYLWFKMANGEKLLLGTTEHDFNWGNFFEYLHQGLKLDAMTIGAIHEEMQIVINNNNDRPNKPEDVAAAFEMGQMALKGTV